MAPRALRHKQRNYYFCILQSRNDCGHSGFAFSRERVVTGSGICFANRSAAQKFHWGFHALRAPPSFLVLFWRAKENVSGGNAFYKSHINLPPHEYPLHKKQLIFVKKQNNQTRGTCRGNAPPSCSRKNVLPLESPTGAFIAAQPRSGCFAIIKNIFSAEYAQSEAAGILNHQSVSPAKFPPLPAGWALRPHCPGR